MCTNQLYKIVTCEGIEYSINEEYKTASVAVFQSNAAENLISKFDQA